MQLPLQVTFKNMDPSPAVEARIREKVMKLDQFHGRIMGCRVVVEAPHRRGQKGKLYKVSVDITVPGGEIVVDREKRKSHAHEDIFVALRDAFNAAARQLEDSARRMRQDVKTHEAPLHGKVLRLFPYEGYGFIDMSDGREVYFHRNSVVEGTFDELEEGAEVRVVVAEKEGEQGPQASTVKPVGKHHVVG